MVKRRGALPGLLSQGLSTKLDTYVPLSPKPDFPRSPTPWYLTGIGGMDYGGYQWGVYRDYYRIHSPIPY